MSSLYSVVYLKIPKDKLDLIKDNIQNKFIEICNSIDTQFISNQLEEFYINPHNSIERHRYIFIGNYRLLDDKKEIQNIENILKEISEKKFINLEKTKNSSFFQNSLVSQIQNFIDISNKFNNEILHFIPHTILPDDTISNLHDIISLSIPNLLTEQIFLFSNKSKLFPITWFNDIKFDIIEALRLYIDKIHPNTKIPSIQDIKYILWCFGVPYNVLDNIISNNFSNLSINEPNNIQPIIDNDLISIWIKSYLLYSTQSFRFTHYHNKLIYPLLSNPFIYMDDNNQYYKDTIKDTSKYFHIDYTSYKYIIQDVLIPNDNTIYMYNSKDFEHVVDDDTYDHIYSKFFPNWNGKKVDFKDYEKNMHNLEKAYDIYDKISTSFNFYNNTDLISSNDYNPLYIELHYRIYDYKKTDILDIFNSIIPSFNLPFIVMKDPLTKEYVYKIYRPITQKVDINDDEFPVSFNELDRWINYLSYSVENGKVKDNRDHIRGIQLKLLWNVVRLNDIKKEGKIMEIYNNNELCSIVYNNKIYRDIPFNNQFIYNFNENIKKDDIIFYYEPKKTYIDLLIDNNSHVFVKCPWKYLYDIPNINISQLITNYLNDIMPIVSEFIINFSSWNTNNTELDIINFNNYNRYLNGSIYIQEFDFKYTIELSKEYEIIYSDFINSLRLLQSILIVNEPVLRKDDIVEYYNIDKKKWVSVKIVDYNIENDSFKIQLLNKTGSIDNIKRNFLRTMKDGKTLEKINEINFTYRKVSDFSVIGAIEQYILKLKQTAKANINIIEDINVKFNINDINKATNIFNSYSEKIRLLNYLKFETGVDISIDYLNKIQSNNPDKIKYNIYVKKIHSINELNNILNIINYIFSLYIIKTFKINTDDLYVKYIQSLLDKTEIIEPIIIDKPTSLDINYILDEPSYDIDDLFSDDISDIIDETIEPLEEEIVEEKKENISEKVEDSKNKEALEKQTALAKGSTKGETPLLTLLHLVDNNLFNWKIGKDTKYARKCQKIKQVAVLTDDEKKQVDRENHNSYIYDSNTICDKNNPEFMNYLSKCKKGKKNVECPPNKTNIKCAALKWGSTPDNQNWYICPRIFDVKLRKSLNIDDLKKIKILDKKFISKDNLDGWRTDKDTGDDIIEFINKDLYDPKLLIIKDDLNIYPGFIDSVNYNGRDIYAPCCYNKSSQNVFNVFTDTKTEATNINYVLQWGKELGDNRYGYLSDFLYKCFNTNPCSTTNSDCLKRQSSIHTRNSLLYAFSLILDKDYDTLIMEIISKLKLDIFNKLNRGLLKHKFTNIGNISPLQNFIEYLLSNEYKNIEYFYDLITYLFNFNLLIIEYGFDPYKIDDYNYNIVIPYYISNRKLSDINKLDVAVLFKNRDINNYEVLDYKGYKKFKNGQFKKIDELINSVWNLISRNTVFNNDAPSNKSLTNLVKTNRILFLEDAINYISKNFKNFQYIYDNYQIIGIYIIDNSLFVPIYPTEIPLNNDYDDDIQLIDFSELKNNRNTLLHTLNKYQNDINIFMNKLNKSINIRYFYKNDNNKIVGIMTNYSVYVPLKDTNIDEYDNNIPIKTNIFKIMDEMDETLKLENNNYYIEPIEYNNVISLIKHNNYNIIKRKNKYIGILDNKTKLFYPIKHIDINIISIKDNVKELLENNNIIVEGNINDYLSRAINFYNSYNIPLRPIRLYFEINKKICKGFILETGDIIEFKDKYHIRLNSEENINTIKELINNIVMNNIANKLNKISLSRDYPLYTDKRILSNEFIEYHINIYDHIIKVLNDFFKKGINTIYKETFISILSSNDYNKQIKMRLIKPIFIAIMKILFKNGNNNDIKKCNNEKVNLVKINNINEYIWNIYFMKFDNITEDEIKDKWVNTFDLSIDKYNIQNRYDIFKKEWYDNFSNNDINYDKVLDIYNNLYKQYEEYEICMYEINKNSINIVDLVDRLFHDLIKNKIIRNMILYEYTKIELTDRYIIHDDVDEIILKSNAGEKMWNDISLLYEQYNHIYYNNLLNLNDIQYESAFTIEISESDKLREKNIYMKNSDIVDSHTINEIIEKENSDNLIKILDKYSNFNIVGKECEKYIYASFYRYLVRENVQHTIKDVDELKKTKYKGYKKMMKELENNELMDIDIEKLRDVLNDLVNNLFSINTDIDCIKLNIIFRLYDGSYIYPHSYNITDDMKNGKWYIINVYDVDNIIYFKEDKIYKYDEIENIISE